MVDILGNKPRIRNYVGITQIYTICDGDRVYLKCLFQYKDLYENHERTCCKANV